MKLLLQKLVETPGPAGYESQVRALIRTEIETYVDKIQVDNLGNLIARKKGSSPESKKIMLAAHMDEVGFIATHIDANGFVRFLPIGNPLANACPAGQVRFLNGARGVISLEKLKDAGQAPGFEKMYIDLGVSSLEECPVQVGDLAVFERPFLDLGNRIISKALDGRAGVAVLIETLRQIGTPLHDIYFVFTVQEEVGMRGAITAAFNVNPHLGLAVDVTNSGDTPRGMRIAVNLGEGPAIKVRDQGMLSDPRLITWMVDTALKAGVPYQMEVNEEGNSDAQSIQLAHAGVPAGCLSIPCRYMRTSSEMVEMSDLHNSLRLLLELLRSPIPC